MFKRIKKYFRKRIIKKQKSLFKREKIINSFISSNNVGVIFTFKDEQSYSNIMYLINHYIKNTKNISIIGFYKGKKIPNYFDKQLKYNYFGKKDLNWYGKPKPIFVKEFINEDFDMLIDLNMENNYPMQFILALSRAKFKVGKQKKNSENHYDFMMSLPEGKSVDDLIYNINEYTKKIKGE